MGAPCHAVLISYPLGLHARVEAWVRPCSCRLRVCATCSRGLVRLQDGAEVEVGVGLYVMWLHLWKRCILWDLGDEGWTFILQDFGDILRHHRAKDADITIATTKVDWERAPKLGLVHADPNTGGGPFLPFLLDPFRTCRAFSHQKHKHTCVFPTMCPMIPACVLRRAEVSEPCREALQRLVWWATARVGRLRVPFETE